MAPIYDGFGPLWYGMGSQPLGKNPGPISASSIVHDNACRNSVCSSIVLKSAVSNGTPTIYATDLSPAMIDKVKKRLGLESVKSEVMGSEAFSFPDGMFTHPVPSMLHPTTLRPDVGTKEILRTLNKPGGVALSAQFASDGWLGFAEAAVHKIRSDAPPFKGPVPEEWKTVDWFKNMFVDAGFQAENVQVHMITIKILFKDMWPEARVRMCKAVVNMAAGSWSAADENAPYAELMKRFNPKTADDDGLDHETQLLVAKK